MDEGFYLDLEDEIPEETFKPLGPRFSSELKERGLVGLPISWSPSGKIVGREKLTEEQKAALDAAIADHDPALESAPRFTLTKLQITDRMSDTQIEEFNTELQAQGTRLLRAWLDCTIVASWHSFYANLHAAMTAKWGKEEADRLLSPIVIGATKTVPTN